MGCAQKDCASNITSGGTAGASLLLFVHSLDYACTHLVNDAMLVKGGGARQFNGLVDVCEKTLASDGLAGLYRGFTLFSTSASSPILLFTFFSAKYHHPLPHLSLVHWSHAKLTCNSSWS